MTLDELKRLDPNKIGSWPILPKLGVLFLLLIALVGAAYWFDWQDQLAQIDGAKAKEEQLRTTFLEKKKTAIDLPAYRKQLVDIESQLLFKPGQVVVRDFYAELPIAIRLTGGFHDLAAFCSDVSNLARIVTLNDLRLQLDDATGQVLLEATAKTYRYLDAEEIAQARREAAKAKQAGRPGAPAGARK